MRQIKFRVWDSVWKSFIDPSKYEIIFSSTNTSFGKMILKWNDYFPEEMFYSPNQTLNQFTGLHDKDGKEIYEGDILFNDMSEWKYSVSWDDLLFAFILNHVESQTWIFLHEINEDINCFEVIGNIYENSNLLENENRRN